MEVLVKNVLGIEAHILRAGSTTITCISDPAPVPWACDALLVGMTANRLKEAEERLPKGLVDAAKGTITISFNTFLVQTEHNTVLIDGGIGNDKIRVERPSWHKRSERYLDALAALGVVPEAVDTVINTHLHADHTGWNTRWSEGRWIPTFPQARYLCAQSDLDYWAARHTDDRARGGKTLFGSFEDSVVPLLDAGLLEGLPSDAKPVDGMSFHPAPGHSPGMIAVHIETDEGPLHLWSDITHHLVQFLWNEVISIACTDAAQARQTRIEAISKAIQEDAVVAGTHLAMPVFGRINKASEQLSITGV